MRRKHLYLTLAWLGAWWVLAVWLTIAIVFGTAGTGARRAQGAEPAPIPPAPSPKPPGQPIPPAPDPAPAPQPIPPSFRWS